MGSATFRILSFICMLQCLGLAILISASLLLAADPSGQIVGVTLLIGTVFLLGAIWLLGIRRHLKRADTLLQRSTDPARAPFRPWLSSLRMRLSWALLGLSLFLAVLLYGVVERIAGGTAVFG